MSGASSLPPVDTQELTARMTGQELIQRKLEMDALRGRLTDPKAKEKKLREAVEGFEAIFVQKIWQQMRATVPKEGYLHSKEEEFWQGMFDQELAKKMTAAGGIGLADMLYDQLNNSLNDASRTTAPSRVSTPLPVRPLREAETPAPVEAAETPETPLYTPFVEETAQPTAETASPESSSATGNPGQIPPPFTQEDADVMTRVNDLARSLVSDSPAPATVPGTPDPSGTQGVSNSSRFSDTPRATPASLMSDVEATPVSAMGGPVVRGPEMGMLNWPLPGRITSGFGWRNDPFTGEREWHAGLDIAGDEGDPIAAAWDGTVVYAGEREGYGNLVVLQHEGGWQSYYGHASKLDVEVGEQVRSGKKIAEVGNTGRSTGPHLHFEIRQGELAWNPEQVRNRLMAGLSVGRRS